MNSGAAASSKRTWLLFQLNDFGLQRDQQKQMRLTRVPTMRDILTTSAILFLRLSLRQCERDSGSAKAEPIEQVRKNRAACGAEADGKPSS
jgi:hypothetical protein